MFDAFSGNQNITSFFAIKLDKPRNMWYSKYIMEYTDETNIDVTKTYKCGSCHAEIIGNHLLPIIRRRLQEIDGVILPTGELVCSVKRCCFCRGDVVELEYSSSG